MGYHLMGMVVVHKESSARVMTAQIILIVYILVVVLLILNI